MLILSLLSITIDTVHSNQPNSTLVLGTSLTNSIKGTCYYHYFSVDSYYPYKPLLRVELTGPDTPYAVAIEITTINSTFQTSNAFVETSDGPDKSPSVSYVCPEGIDSRQVQELKVCPFDYDKSVEYTVLITAEQSILFPNGTTIYGVIPNSSFGTVPRLYYYIEITEDIVSQSGGAVLRIHGAITEQSSSNSASYMKINTDECPSSSKYDYMVDMKDDSSWSIIEIRSDGTGESNNKKMVAGRYYIIFGGSSTLPGKNFALGACMGEGCTIDQPPFEPYDGNNSSGSRNTISIRKVILFISMAISLLLLLL